jgi:hypothetical protein
MRHISIVERLGDIYSFAAVDQATGEIPLKLPDRATLVALCVRLGWTVDDDAKSAGKAGPILQPRSARRIPRHRLGGASAYTSSGRRRRSARS